jgi:hypothetical protein
MIKPFALIAAILTASVAVPTRSEAHPALAGPALVLGIAGIALSFRQATRYTKQQRVRTARSKASLRWEIVERRAPD